MFEATLEKINSVDSKWIEKAEARQMTLTKPPRSLGKLEGIANRICAVQKTLVPNVSLKKIIVCAGSHGVTEEDVSPYPSEVTAQMVANFLNGGAAINALAKTSNAKIDVVNVGVKGEVSEVEINDENCRYISKKVADGTKNFANESAMSKEETLEAIDLGIQLAKNAKQEGINLIGLGEMGIGNTTSASAITSALTGLPAKETVGRGTGADDEMLQHKIEVVEKSLNFHSLNSKSDALDILQKVGGLEIACLVGICIGAAFERVAIVTDGFIATSAVGIATKIEPKIKDYVFASHLSVETGHTKLLELINQKALFDLDMRLGEGTGAALAFGMIESAVNAFNEMATFEKAAVSNKG